MGTAIVATTKVADVLALTAQLTNRQLVGESSYYLLQRSDDITDWKEGTPDIRKIEEYKQGRLFGVNGEIRWEKTTDGYTLLWLSEGDADEGVPEPFITLSGEWEASMLQDVFLLGGGETSPWRDTRIPRELKYPYPKKWCKSPKVRVIHYKDLRSQTIRFTRYTDFIE